METTHTETFTDTQRIDWLIRMANQREGARCLLCTVPNGFVIIRDNALYNDPNDIPEVVGDYNSDLRACIDCAMRRIIP